MVNVRQPRDVAQILLSVLFLAIMIVACLWIVQPFILGFAWAGAPPAGEITVDEGATAAILERGSSLLPKGIKSVTGNFSRGEVIRICNLEGRDIAHGVSRYNSDALRRIAGHHSQEIDAILGYEYGPVAVHRDDMITR